MKVKNSAKLNDIVVQVTTGNNEPNNCFCGTKELLLFSSKNTDKAFIICPECNRSTGTQKDRMAAIDVWNKDETTILQDIAN